MQVEPLRFPVEIVRMPIFRVACLEHRGPLEGLGASRQRFIQWRKSKGLSADAEHRTYACFHTDPRTTPAQEQHVDLCLSTRVELENDEEVCEKWLGGGRYARVRHHGSPENIPAALWLHTEWLPASDESLDENRPMMFHFLNVGPNLKESELETDVYLPLRERSSQSS